MSTMIDRMPLVREQDLVLARQQSAADRRHARLRPAGPGADRHRGVGDRAQRVSATRAAAASTYAVEGERAPQILLVRVADRGPGIANLDEILDGRYRSTTGMGIGLIGARRLMDRFEIDVGAEGHDRADEQAIRFPRAAASRRAAVDAHPRGPAHPAPHDAGRRAAAAEPGAVIGARRCARTAGGARAAQSRAEDTNRGVVALYAELDEKADHLRRADEMKSRFLSNMSHEFRTPLNSIRALTGLLLDRVDGPLADEQERQVALVRKAADDLSNLVEDLLDLAQASRPAPRDPCGRIRGRRPVQRAARNAAAAAGRRRRSASLRVCSGLLRRSTPTKRRCRRSCGTSFPTRSSSPRPAA